MDWETVEKKTHPLKKARWVRAKAHIRCNATGDVRVYETDEILHDGEKCPSPYIWEEGNFCCDCNRVLFFKRAAGDDPDLDDTPCSDGLFSVNLQNPKTGEFYYREFDG